MLFSDELRNTHTNWLFMNSTRFFKNSLFNILSGIFTALVNVGLPPLLARTLDVTTFSAWILLLQIGAYLNYLNLGGQVVFSKYIAQAHHTSDEILDNKQTVSSGLVFLSGLALVGFFLLLSAIQFVPFFSHLLEKTSIISFTDIFLVFLSFAVIFPISGVNGYFIGLQKNKYVFINNLILRSFIFILVNISASFYGTLQSLSLAYALSHIIILLYICYLFTIKKEGISFNFHFFSKKRFLEIIHFCSGYSAWSLSMFLVSGITLTLVAKFEYKNLAIYSICLSIITAFTGLHSAIFNNLLPELAALDKTFGKTERGNLLIFQTKSSTTILSSIILILLFSGHFLLPIWAGRIYTYGNEWLFDFLVFACCIRWTATPYALHLLATNQQRLGITSAIIEGVATVSMALLFGAFWGATGIIWASMLGGIIGILGNILLNFKNDKFVKINPGTYLCQGVIFPLISITPITACLVTEYLLKLHLTIVRIFAMFIGFALLYAFGSGKSLVNTAKLLLLTKINSLESQNGKA